MSRGKRYNGEAKLNMKKVLAVLVALLVIVMFVFVIYKLVTNGKGERMTNNYYFTSFQDNKYGVINNKGEEVIAPSYQEYIVIPNNKTDIFLCTYDVDYTNNTYKTKALNSQNKEIFTEYENSKNSIKSGIRDEYVELKDLAVQISNFNMNDKLIDTLPYEKHYELNFDYEFKNGVTKEDIITLTNIVKSIEGQYLTFDKVKDAIPIKIVIKFVIIFICFA